MIHRRCDKKRLPFLFLFSNFNLLLLLLILGFLSLIGGNQFLFPAGILSTLAVILKLGRFWRRLQRQMIDNDGIWPLKVATEATSGNGRGGGV